MFYAFAIQRGAFSSRYIIHDYRTRKRIDFLSNIFMNYSQADAIGVVIKHIVL